MQQGWPGHQPGLEAEEGEPAAYCALCFLLWLLGWGLPFRGDAHL